MRIQGQLLLCSFSFLYMCFINLTTNNRLTPYLHTAGLLFQSVTCTWDSRVSRLSIISSIFATIKNLPQFRKFYRDEQRFRRNLRPDLFDQKLGTASKSKIFACLEETNINYGSIQILDIQVYENFLDNK